MDLSKIKKIHLIGIKGVGMTMLADYLSTQGYELTGSDVAEVFLTDAVLAKRKIKVFPDFKPENIPAEADLVIYSTAYKPEKNVELAFALEKYRVLSYAEALGAVFNQKHGIAVVGSHGKTTTTAWLGYVLWAAGKEPSVMTGSRVPQFGGSSIVGKSDYLVVEVDEYQNKLQYFQPKAALLNNIDYDHPDFFPTVASYENVFVDFIKKIPTKGFLVANYDDPAIRRLAAANCRGRVISYALREAADYVAYDIRQEAGKQFFKVKFGVLDEADDDDSGPEILGDFSISLAGKHNVSNALAVIAAAVELGVELYQIRDYLEEFSGTARRLEFLGNFRRAKLYDDYAHHPTEIKATLAGLRAANPQVPLTVVFHPHTFTRTKALLADFAASFAAADQVILLDIYGSAREEQGGVHTRDLLAGIEKYNQENNIQQTLKYLPDLSEAEKYLRKEARPGEVIILMGAGDVFRIGENLLK